MELAVELKELAAEIYATAVEKGFWEKPNVGEKLMLAITELGEAVEADRKGFYAKALHLNDDEKMTVEYFESKIKDTVEDELADTVIRVLDLITYLGLNVGAIEKVFVQGGIIDKTNFAEKILLITGHLFAAYKQEIKAYQEFYLVCFLRDLFTIADQLEIDLLLHIKLKMRYNKTRPYKHGKSY